MSLDIPALNDTPLDQLKEQAQRLGLQQPPRRRSDLAFAVAQALATQRNLLLGRGVLEVHGEGFGFLRSPSDNFLPGHDDIYVSQSQIRRFRLQTGDTVIGQVRPPKEGERYTALLRVESINGDPPGSEPQGFEHLTAIYPDERIAIHQDALLHPIDRIAPLGLGQRGLFVAPSRTGRVEILRHLVDTMASDDDLEVTVLLIGERPEEIEEWRANSEAEVIATPFDDPALRHMQVADIVFERARRQVEHGDDVVLVIDSLTRLLRACMSELPATGREFSGVDVSALFRLRRYLGAARALEEGGSLTVIGVVSGEPEGRLTRALLEDLDEVVNWTCVLSREVANRGIRPPIDVHRSATLRSERLITNDERTALEQFRATLTGDSVEDATNLLAWVHGLPTTSAASR
ncbi:MAG: transcription termination factor Rho [Kiritimatiellia bacterium]|jgi:transcription termination factor Rho